MTDPGIADRTYVEPITCRLRGQGHRARAPRRPAAQHGRPDGPQLRHRARRGRRARPSTAWRSSAAITESIRIGEDRKLFAEAMEDIGLHICRSGFAYSVGRRRAHRGRAGIPRHHPPVASRSAAPAAASPTTWTSCAASWPRASSSRRRARSWWRSPSRAGRKYEMEVMRDCCRQRHHRSAPSRTSTPWACTPATPSPWPRPRRSPTPSTSACATPRSPSCEKIGVDTGGSNVQFAVNPEDGRMIVIEMNPRVSPLLGARLQGHGLPDRQGGGTPRRGPTRSTRSPTTSRRPRRRASSPPSTTAWSRCRASPSRSSRAPTTPSPRA